MSGLAVEFYEETGEGEGRLVTPEWRWRLRAVNGEIVATGEGHRDEHDARRAFRTVVEVMGLAVSYRLDTGVWPGDERALPGPLTEDQVEAVARWKDLLP